MLRTCTGYAKYFDESSACNAEPRIEHMMEQLDHATSGDAATYVSSAFDAKKACYTALQWQDMAAQRAAWLQKTRPRNAVLHVHKCCNVADWLTKDTDPATKQAILSVVKAPPTTIGMGRPVALTGLEILWRLHVVLGHASIDQVMATLSKTEGMRAGMVTKSDVEAFVKLGCAQCIVWKMRRAPVKSLIDPTLAPPGKKWSYDTLTLKVKTAAGNLYLTRFLDNGSGKKRSYGHKDFTASTLEMLLSLMRAWVRPVHGEIWIGRRDGHPSQRAKSFQDALSEAQIHDESTAPYQHESMPVESTWQHDVPGAMILLSTGPGAKALRHFEQAFLTHEDANNRVVKPRAHGGEAKSADMVYFGESIARANLLYAFWAPLMYLVYPEIRANKFSEHSLPGAYYGPSRETESDRYGLVWNGTRAFAVDKGCMRIDERAVLAMSSRTNKQVQPFTPVPDAAVDLPNFDQWINPAVEAPISSQNVPAIIDDELDAELTMGDPDPTTPFFMFVHAGYRRLGEVGHYVRKLTKGLARVVSIDTKRRGYAHNILLPRVFAWLARLAMLTMCIGIVLSGPCELFTPLRFELSTSGPPVLFNKSNPDGIKAHDGSTHPLVEGGLKVHVQGFALARMVHSHGGSVLIEHPVNHDSESMWPIKGREEHSTLFDTTIFKDFTKDVPGERVYSDQCMAGAETRKSTQWYCNDVILPAAFKYLGTLHCSERDEPGHSYPHTKSLVGKNSQGEWKSKGSDEYTPELCGLIALTLLEGHNFSVPTTSDVFDEFASLAPSTCPPASERVDGGGDELSNAEDSLENDDEIDDAETIDTPYTELEKRIAKSIIPGVDGDAVDGMSALNETASSAGLGHALPRKPILKNSTVPDPYPTGTKVQVFWAGDKQWFNGTILSTEVWSGSSGLNNEPRRQVQISYDDGNVLTHSLHNTMVRTVVLDESTPVVEDVTSNVATNGSSIGGVPSTTFGAPSNPSSPRGPSGPRWGPAPSQPKPPDTPKPKGNPSPSNPKPGNKKPASPPSSAPSPVAPVAPATTPSFSNMIPDHLRVIGNGTVPSFVNNGEKVMALPEEEDHMPARRIGQVCGTTLPNGHFCNQKLGHLGGCSLDANIEENDTINSTAESTGYDDPFDTYTAFNPSLVQVLHKPNFHWSKTVHANSLNSMSKAEAEAELTGLKLHAENKSDEAAASKYFSRGPYLRQFIEELDSINEDAQAMQGDIGLNKFVAATMACNKDILSRVGSTNRYSTCMEQMESALTNNSDLVSIVSHEIDIGYGQYVQRHMIMAMVDGVEITIDPLDANTWHTPKNQREYLRSPQRAQWRTAKEKKMDQYQQLKVFKLVPRAGLDPKRIMGSLWAFKIKFNELGKFDKLNPRWCVKGYGMDKSIYVGFSEVCLTTSIKILACIRAAYPVKDYIFDCGNAFQATRTDDGTVKSEKLYCEQAPGFNVKTKDGAPMVCEILVALQGRVDAARLFGDRLEQIIFKLGGTRSTWDPKVYLFHFGPLVNTSATLGEVLTACKASEHMDDKNGAPIGWAALAVHVDDCPGVGSSDRIINYIKAGIMVQYECVHGPWKKVLGFKFTCTENTVIMSAEHTIETMYNTFLINHPKYDARLPGRDVKLTAGEAPAGNDPRLFAYLEMQTETRSLLGLLLWVSLAYPQISHCVNKACGFMSNPSHEVNAYAKHIALHLYQYPVAVKWGGATDLELSQPSPPPFTEGEKEMGLHFAADASPDDAARGITGGVGMLCGGAIITVSARQHLATPDMHANEVLAAGTIMHKIVPLRGLLTEMRIPQEQGTPLYIDSASTVFVAQSRGAVKKSAWIRRRAEVLTEAFDMGECDPRKIEEYNNFSDPETKYLVYRVWMRHLHYTHNLDGEPPPPVIKPSKKGPTTAKVLTAKEKQDFLLLVGL